MKVSLPYFSLQPLIMDYLDPALREGDVETCIDSTNTMLGMLPKSQFHCVQDLDFTTRLEDTARKLDAWVLEQEAERPFGSAYAETNYFAHNAAEWHFDWFAYESEGREGGFDYLGEDGWISIDHENIILTGMETLQAAFLKDWNDEDEFAREICECQVVFKFMRFMQAVSGSMEQFRHPLVVSSHDWDRFLRISPGGSHTAAQVF